MVQHPGWFSGGLICWKIACLNIRTRLPKSLVKAESARSEHSQLRAATFCTQSHVASFVIKLYDFQFLGDLNSASSSFEGPGVCVMKLEA